jgi:methylenetetrahydrofolate dehydrogenase (NADP+)/methenyltetrahydrofolate cyclohydrolase
MYNTSMRLSGKEISQKLYGELKKRVTKLQKKNITPHLVVLLVGENPASVAYVRQKQKNGEEIGAQVTVLNYKTSVTTEELEEKVKLLNIDPFVHGILIQRPLPEHIDVEKLEMLTDPQKDIDGFHPDSPYTLPLPLAVVKILEEVYSSSRDHEMAKQSQKNKRDRHASVEMTNNFKTWLQTQNIALLGKGPTGGGPIIEHLKTINVTPQLIDSKTKNPQEILKKADIIISAVGKEHTVKPEQLKHGVVLISVGINRSKENKLHGDYDEETIKNIASYYTPTPGGVGPVNVAMLWENLLTATEKQTKK